MASFATPAWDANEIADKYHTKLFERSKNNFKPKLSRVTKIKKRSPRENKLSETSTQRSVVKKTRKPKLKDDAFLKSQGQQMQKTIKFNNIQGTQSPQIPKKSKRNRKRNKNVQMIEKVDRETSQMNKKGEYLSQDKNFVKKPLFRKRSKIIPESPKKNRLKTKERLQNGSTKVEIKNFMSKRKDKLKLSLRERMLEKLKASRFRYINEEIYTNEGRAAINLFRNDPSAFKAYHEGYKQQVSKWPLNPVDVIIKSIKKMSQDKIIADLGCGDAKIARSLSHKVHSFDLVSVNEHVTVSEMSNVPLQKHSVNVVVFCLSLMGTNIRDFIYEANRILKIGGTMKVAEVESRFDKIDTFIKGVEQFGFKVTWRDFSNNLFYFIDFKKVNDCRAKNKLPTIGLLPCLYKKR